MAATDRWRSPATRRAATFALIGAALLIAGFRVYQCSLLPVNTGDVVRHVLYGVLVDELGLRAAGAPLIAYSRHFEPVSWSGLPYNYPVVALASFWAITRVAATLFWAKLALTLCEAASALLVWRLTGRAWIGLLYWASPISIWWVSREGQFEPLQNLLALSSLCLLRRSPFGAALLLSLAVQVKLTAVALVPLLLASAWPDRRRLAHAAAGLALGLAPSVGAQLFYPAIASVFAYSAPLVYNPYFWNPAADLFAWNPGWLVASNQVASYGALAALAYMAVHSGHRIAFVAPIAFLLFCKTHTNVQFWYFLVFPTLIVAIREPAWRAGLFAAWPLLDVRSSVELVFGVFGNLGFRGLPSAFDTYTLPAGYTVPF